MRRDGIVKGNVDGERVFGWFFFFRRGGKKEALNPWRCDGEECVDKQNYSEGEGSRD